VRQTAHGSLALLIGQVLSTLILAVSTIIVAGILGSAQYGEYSKVFVPIGIALLLQDPGITVALTRYVSMYQGQGDEQRRRDTILTGLTFNLATAIALSSILYIFATPIADAFLQQRELDNMLRIASFAVIGQALINATNAIFIGYMRTELQNLTLLIYSIIRGVTSSALVIIGFGLTGAVVGQTASYLIAGATALIITLTLIKNRGSGAHPSWATLREQLKFGTPLYVSNLIGGSLSQIMSSLMVLYVTSSEIGNYGVALTFTVLISFLTSPIGITIYPLFSKLERGSTYLEHAYRNAVKYSSLVAIPAALALIGLADPLIVTIYGDKYPTAAPYFAAYLLTVLTIGVGSSCQGSLLNSQGETRTNMWRNVLSLATGAPLALIFIPRFGILGLIASIIASAYPAIIYGHFIIKSKLGITFDRSSSLKIYVDSLAALAPTILILYITNIPPIIELALGALIYFASYLVMLKATHTLNEDDYQMFQSILGTTGPLSKPLLRLLSIYEKL